MIKKLFLCAALVGAVGLTSCVDDVESTSAQAVRQAKAEQLRAAGDLEKANAQAALVLANAEQQAAQTAAAAKQAQAELDKANAAYQNALAAYQQAQANAVKAQSDIEKQEAEVALQQAQVQLERDQVALEQAKINLQTNQSNLQKLIAQYEKDLAQAAYDAENYRQELQNLIAQADADAYVKLQTLVTTYNGAYNTLYNLQVSLNDANLTIAKYEAGLSSQTDFIQDEIDNANDQIASLNKEIKKYQDAIAALQTSDVQAAVQKYDEIKAQLVTLQKEEQAAQQARQEAYVAQANAQAALSTSNYTDAINNLINSGDFEGYTVDNYYRYSSLPTYWGNSNIPADLAGKWYVTYTERNASDTDDVTKYIALFTDGKKQRNDDNKYYIGENSWYQYAYREYVTPYYEAIPEGCDEYASLLDKAVAGYQKKVDNAAAQLKKYTDAQSALSTAEADYKTAKANNTDLDKVTPALTDAQIAERQQAQKKAAEDMLKAINAVNKVLDPKNYTEIKWADVTYAGYFDTELKDKTILNSIDQKVEDYTKDNYNPAVATLASKKSDADAIKANLNAIKAGSADYAKLVANVNEANKAYAEAQLAYKVAEENYDNNKSLLVAYDVVVNGASASDIADLIQDNQNNILNCETYIEQWNVLLIQFNKDLEAGNLDEEELVAKTKANIAKLEAQIAAQQKVVDAAKANLDAALAEE